MQSSFPVDETCTLKEKRSDDAGVANRTAAFSFPFFVFFLFNLFSFFAPR